MSPTEPVIHEPSHQEHATSEQHELEHSSHEEAHVAPLPEYHQEPPVEKALERTFALIKPHVIASHKAGRIISLIEENKFTIVALKLHRLTKEEAAKFYEVHHDKPFFAPLVELMTSGPSVLMVLDRPHAITAWRELAGETNPEDARPGTIRAMYGESKQNNAVHGADSIANAAREIELFFPELSASHHKTAIPTEDNEHVLNLSDEFDEDDTLTLTPSEIAAHGQHTNKHVNQPASYQA
jgi:nucleoside-diphosphate kinase